MRGVNIHADFVMIQCTKNKNLTPLSHPLCHPAIRRGSNNVYSGPRVPPLTRLSCLGVGRKPEDGTLGSIVFFWYIALVRCTIERNGEGIMG